MAVVLTMEGIDELADSMTKAISNCPDELNSAMKKVIKGFGDDVNDKYPAKYSKKIRTWRSRTSYGARGIISEATLTNAGPHFHLVENGHKKYDFHGNPTGGWVAGKHYAEKTRNEYDEKYPELVSEAVDDVLKKAGLA